MFSFLKFLRKISNTILFINGPHFLEDFYQSPLLEKAKWVSLAINKTTIAGSVLTKELDIKTENETFSLKLAETKNGYVHKLWKNKNLKGKTLVTPQSSLLNEFNTLIDHKIKSEIKYFQEELNKEMITTYSPFKGLAEEEKALEWMRVSFMVLEKAIIESLTNSEFLFQSTFFFGENPNTKKREVRLITFNLDIQFILLPNGYLRIQIFNDKEQAFGTSKKAVLEGDFNVRKKEMFDQLIQLIATTSSGFKIL